MNATVERHLKGDKVLVFKKKRRKGYQKLNGFRPSLTELVIKGISLEARPPKAKAKASQPDAGRGRSGAKGQGSSQRQGQRAKAKAAPKASSREGASQKPAAKKAASPKKDSAKKQQERRISKPRTMAHKKAAASTKNGRESESKRLGVKIYGGQLCICRQHPRSPTRTPTPPRHNVGIGKDHTFTPSRMALWSSVVVAATRALSPSFRRPKLDLSLTRD